VLVKVMFVLQECPASSDHNPTAQNSPARHRPEARIFSRFHEAVLDLIVLFGIALGLAMDAFAVSIAVSIALGGASRRQTFRLAWHFGLFQALMPVIGWMAGTSIQPLIERWDHWIAFILLTTVGVRMIHEALSGGDPEPVTKDPTRGWSLVVLSIATSIDALAVGLSFAALGVKVWGPSAIIGITAGAVTFLGTVGGRVLGTRFGTRMAVVGGIVLIAIGGWISITHLMGI
jgi:putative Mn2+ efflux pump MntP